jgi:hypothetical protein
MRRAMAVVSAVLVLALAGAAGCGDSKSPAGTAAPASSGPADDAKQVCAEVVPLNRENAQRIRTAFNKAADDAVGEGDAERERLVQVAFTGLKPQLTTWVARLDELAATTTNPQLKLAMQVFVTAMKRVLSPEGTTSGLHATGTLTVAVHAVCFPGDPDKKVCLDVAKLNFENQGHYRTRFLRIVEEGLAAELSEAERRRVTEAGVAELGAFVTTWGVKVRELAAGASDPVLKAALDAFAVDLKPMESGNGPIYQLELAIRKLDTAASEVCD